MARSGLKKMLEEGVKDEQKRLEASANQENGTSDVEENPKEKKPPKPDPKPEPEPMPKATEQKTDTEPEEKNKGGRPSYETTGETKRKQYTLTLIPEFYDEITAYRDTHKKRNGKKMSFAEFLETAAIEYMDNHK